LYQKAKQPFEVSARIRELMFLQGNRVQFILIEEYHFLDAITVYASLKKAVPTVECELPGNRFSYIKLT